MVVSSYVAPRSPIACLNRSGFVRVVVTTEYPVPHGLGGSCLGTTGTTGATGTLYCGFCIIEIQGLIACADTASGVSSARVTSIGFMVIDSKSTQGLGTKLQSWRGRKVVVEIASYSFPIV